MTTSRQLARLEIHEHSWISGPNANRSWLRRIEHSHADGHIPHSHPDTGPACYTIDKDKWFRATGMMGGGKKKYTTKPTGPQLDFIPRPEEDSTFDVIMVDRGYSRAHQASGISEERYALERADFLEVVASQGESGSPAVSRMAWTFGLTPNFRYIDDRHIRDEVPAPRPAETAPKEGTTMIVEFQSLEAFLAELAERGPNVEPIVRVTEQLQEVKPGAPAYYHAVGATYLRQPQTGGVQIMTWKGLAGQRLHPPVDRESRDVVVTALQWMETIKTVATRMKLTVGGGTYLPGGGL